MIHHVITGDFAANPLKEAIATTDKVTGVVLPIKDVLTVGPLKRAEGQKFSALRTEFWREVLSHEKDLPEVGDLESLLMAANELSKKEQDQIWIWVSPWPTDYLVYLWALKYLVKYQGRVYVVNIGGLPFLDADKKLYFPKSFSEVSPAEMAKASKLARPVTPSEFEILVPEWEKMVEENAPVRIKEGHSKFKGVPEKYYDSLILEQCTQQFQRASKVINQVLTKDVPTPGDLYLAWRLRKLAETGLVKIQGDTTRHLKDFEVKLAEDTLF